MWFRGFQNFVNIVINKRAWHFKTRPSEGICYLISIFGIQIQNLNPQCFQWAGTQTTWTCEFLLTSLLLLMNVRCLTARWHLLLSSSFLFILMVATVLNHDHQIGPYVKHFNNKVMLIEPLEYWKFGNGRFEFVGVCGMFCRKLPNTVGQILLLRLSHIAKIIKISVASGWDV